MWRMSLIALALLASGCATRTGAKAEVDAVVQSEDARQAAVNAAASGEGSKAALKAGAAAADPATATPPT
jgi:hypothetical protein